MAYEATNAKETFYVETPEYFKGWYVFDPHLPKKPWANRNSYDPWTWWSQVETDFNPHITTWANDFKGGKLATFHITFYHEDNSAKPVHVYYKIDGNRAVRTSVDSNRAGGDSQAARDYYFNYKSDFDGLAQAFIDKAFA